MATKERKGGLWKASPKLRRYAQQAVRDEEGKRASWRGQVARQQAAVQYKPPESKGPAEVPREATTTTNVYLQLDPGVIERMIRQGQATSETSATGNRLQIHLDQEESVEVLMRGALGIASVTEDQLGSMLENEVVQRSDMAEPIRRPIALRGVTVAAGEIEERAEERNIGLEELHGHGAGVLIGIIDVDGFDFAHEDFRDGDKTRFVRIWDQAGSFRPAPVFPGRETYGAEITREHMNAAIAKSAQTGLAPYHLEPQSSVVTSSHGTHVASIAAGNSGLCRKADIAAVLIDLPEADLDRRRTFSDSTRIADAIEYLLNFQQEHSERYKAVSINISLGTNGHAHDGTSLASRWIDTQFAQQGRSICIAAGNAGQEKPEAVDDLGFILGRIHASGKIEAAGLRKDLKLTVAGFPVEDISENEIEIWYAPQDRINVSVRPPNNGRWTETIRPGSPSHEERARSADGKELSTVIGIWSEVYRPENGANHLSIFLTPAREGEGAHVEPGEWTIRLHGAEIRDGRYDAWIERDDPIPIQGLAPFQLWHYPSFFTEESNVDRSSISTLACTSQAIAVANVDERAERIAISSSQGPTRDGRQKPEIGAPGTEVAAANGFHPTKKWVAMTGTSMASPFAAGVAGLMLAVEPSLTPAQIRAIMIRTARPLPGANYAWHDDAGYGRICPEGCIQAVKELQDTSREVRP